MVDDPLIGEKQHTICTYVTHAVYRSQRTRENNRECKVLRRFRDAKNMLDCLFVRSKNFRR